MGCCRAVRYECYLWWWHSPDVWCHLQWFPSDSCGYMSELCLCCEPGVWSMSLVSSLSGNVTAGVSPPTALSTTQPSLSTTSLFVSHAQETNQNEPRDPQGQACSWDIKMGGGILFNKKKIKKATQTSLLLRVSLSFLSVQKREAFLQLGSAGKPTYGK